MVRQRVICFLIGFLLFFFTTILLSSEETSNRFEIIHDLSSHLHLFPMAGLVGFSGGIIGLLLGFFYLKKDSTNNNKRR